jgi:5-methyltetrahydropteroyltriglutamate--homocysteine methyltransferase
VARAVGPPFRADHVGSLLRPSALKALRLERESGRASEAELRAAEDVAIRAVVAPARQPAGERRPA